SGWIVRGRPAVSTDPQTCLQVAQQPSYVFCGGSAVGWVESRGSNQSQIRSALRLQNTHQADILGDLDGFGRLGQLVRPVSYAAERLPSTGSEGMTELALSVVIPTRNRPASLAQTVSCLSRQELSLSEYEIVVVDDGSSPPVVLSRSEAGPRLTVLQRSNGERAAARNGGAAARRAGIIVFVDDDITVCSDFLAQHLSAH